MVYKAVQTSNLAAQKLDLLRIRWVKAHLDDSELHRGNAFADSSAKIGASMQDVESLVLPEEIPQPTISAVKTAIYPYFEQEWDRRWINNLLGTIAKCRQTKQWFPHIDKKKSCQLLLGRSRYEFSILIHAITGHNHLAYHEHKQNSEVSPTCTLCNQEGSHMDTQHLFTDCEALGLIRQRIFGTHNPEVPFKLGVGKMVHFLRETDIGWLPDDERAITEDT